MRTAVRLTGLGADTLRVWERRYNAVCPGRTSGGGRRYSQQDIRRLQTLAEASARGHKIKDLAGLSDEELAGLLSKEDSISPIAAAAGQGASSTSLSQRATETGGLSHPAQHRLIEEYLGLVERFEASRAEALLGKSAAMLKPKEFLFDLALPILHRTGANWEKDRFTPAHEHLISQQIKSLLISLMRYTNVVKGAPKVLVATPAGMFHEIGALTAAFLASNLGLESIYLGPDLPDEDLVLARKLTGGALMILSVIDPGSMGQNHPKRLRQSLSQLLEQGEVWVGASSNHPVQGWALPGLRVFSSFDAFEAALVDYQTSGH